MRRALALAVVSLLALAAGCSGEGGSAGDETSQTVATGTGTTSGSTTSSPATSTGSGTSTETTTTATADGDDGFEYVPWGPDDPPIPGHYAAMAASSGTAPRCDDVADQQPEAAFWFTVVEVCRALAEGGPWPESTEVPAPPPPENAYIACVDTELRQMVERALRWHADNPGRLPDVRYPASSERSLCQAHIYDVRVLGEEHLREGEGHPDGVAVAVTGSSMNSVAEVRVDGEPVELTGDFDVPEPGDGLTTVVVLAARSSQPRTAQVEVRTDTDVLTTVVELPGAPGGGETATDAPTDAPTHAPSDAPSDAPTDAATMGPVP